ncbi:MAG: argininosuccinate lyase [Candidatus Margulisiibacteriota bacterium]|nr:MAG: argininosuccinate lyase [Candidatus Margulisbacteria bacterium GWD2_39_127]OGI04592.1 MAG: argininosuccinate lyase [Candidatus Margulisbacteria bacterium GWF2_38_17]OGI11876.1 MAG: argininosuccinate lyase [Candidatus Margulisbacteria bacterium GWE2_39_32]PZM83113.1 MAG: argininosuccinate lyase [Candidatus Margulisiibacteriota bacterium]HAR62219.1 argininosuccinate lyase [Candidatus Margulisiibacteriota bacterium]
MDSFINPKLWGGRFSSSPNELVEHLTESISFDYRLYRVDIIGSKAHAKALEKIGIISQKELTIVIEALDEIIADIESGNVEFREDLEDIHMNVEYLLTERIGELGKKIHTGRSRNDQIATDLRLYLKKEIHLIVLLILDLQKVLLALAKNNIDIIMPGFTHLQIAQPVLFSHHMMAYFEMLQRDRQRFTDCLTRMDSLPLGSAALAGSTFCQDRKFLAKELEFTSYSANSMDAVCDRDFAIEFLSSASILMMHLSRFSEEIILWLSAQFRYISIDDAFTTGSSIMPQKRNPDVAELTRGKTGRVYGDLMAMLTIMKGLPLTYNRDLQEDKEPLFDTIDTLSLVLPAFTAMVETIKVDREHLYSQSREGFAGATDFADFLSCQGVPFRDSHRIVGNLVKYCEDNEKYLDELTVEELYLFIPKDISLPDDLDDLLSPEASIKAREIPGGTGRSQVMRAISAAEKIISSIY